MRRWDGELHSTATHGLPLRAVETSKPHKSLKEALAHAGAIPSAQIARARGLLHRWFRKESPLLTTINTVLSLFLLALALTMTFIGMRIAQRFGLVVTLNEAANAISPYAGVALLSLGILRLLQNLFVRDSGWPMRLYGFVEAGLLLAAGAWAEAVAWYTGSIPFLLKPSLQFAGGEITAYLLFFSVVVVPFFKPAMAAVLGLLLTAKQIKTTALSGGSRAQWFVALIGLLASACVLIIGMDTGNRQLIGRPGVHSLSAERHADLWARQFSSPFAPGVPCRVSDTFGPRLNPFYFMKPKPTATIATPTPATAAPSDSPTGSAGADELSAKPQPVFRIGSRIENHPGVDVAARAGTAVHALAAGTVIFIGSDAGFGNMVVLRLKDTTRHETTFLLGHMELLNVRSGQSVAKDDVLGWVGSTGRSTGPHLHLQICPMGHVTARGGFACGQPANPYENWLALEAIARLSCTQGPVGL